MMTLQQHYVVALASLAAAGLIAAILVLHGEGVLFGVVGLLVIAAGPALPMVAAFTELPLPEDRSRIRSMVLGKQGSPGSRAMAVAFGYDGLAVVLGMIAGNLWPIVT